MNGYDCRYGEADNNFPTQTSQEVFERYYRAMERVCDRIMRHLGRGLGGNEEMFLHATSKHTSNAVVAYHAAAPPVRFLCSCEQTAHISEMSPQFIVCTVSA